jgi:IS5 family transposase
VFDFARKPGAGVLGFLAGRFDSVCRFVLGRPPLPTRFVAGLLILKHMYDLSDETLCDRWVKNPLSSTSAGMWFQRAAPFDRSSLRLAPAAG